jgi:hypothetical protein
MHAAEAVAARPYAAADPLPRFKDGDDATALL